MPTGVRVLITAWLLLAVLFLGLGMRRALGHEWYDPYCCNSQDCRRIAPDDVVASPKGYRVLGKYDVPYLDKSIKPSQDADYHACEFPAGTLRCFYVPGGGV